MDGTYVKEPMLHVLIKKCEILTAADIKIITLLLQYGLRLELTDAIGLAPLYIAAIHHKIHMVQLLLNAGANPNTLIGGFPLLHACLLKSEALSSDDEEIIQSLVIAGADLFSTDRNGKTAAQIAFEKGFLDIAEYLSQAETNARNAAHQQEMQTLLQVVNTENQTELHSEIHKALK